MYKTKIKNALIDIRGGCNADLFKVLLKGLEAKFDNLLSNWEEEGFLRSIFPRNENGEYILVCEIEEINEMLKSLEIYEKVVKIKYVILDDFEESVEKIQEKNKHFFDAASRVISQDQNITGQRCVAKLHEGNVTSSGVEVARILAKKEVKNIWSIFCDDEFIYASCGDKIFSMKKIKNSEFNCNFSKLQNISGETSIVEVLENLEKIVKK